MRFRSYRTQGAGPLVAARIHRSGLARLSADAQPGLVYGYRVFGPNNPDHGLRFNPHKLLIDPYAKEFVGTFRWTSAHFGFEPEVPGRYPAFDKHDNARDTLKAAVLHDDFDWGDDQHPQIALADSVLYEVHVKGYT